MFKQNQESNNHTLSVLIGVLVGGLAGAGTMFLLAPQSGAKTRMLIQERGSQLRDQTTGILEAGMAQVWLTKNRITRDARRKGKELVRHSQANMAERVESASDAAKAWKKAKLDS